MLPWLPTGIVQLISFIMSELDNVVFQNLSLEIVTVRFSRERMGNKKKETLKIVEFILDVKSKDLLRKTLASP